MRKVAAFTLAAALGLLLVALWCVRFAAYSVLMLFRWFIEGALKFISISCVFALLIGSIIAPEHHQMLWTIFAVGLGAGILLFCYDALLLILAPDRFPMLLAR